MQESAQSAKISGTPPERGHSCPQQLPNTQQDRNVRALYFRSTWLRTRMSALRFGSGSAGLGTDAPYPPSLSDCFGLACMPLGAQNHRMSWHDNFSRREFLSTSARALT